VPNDLYKRDIVGWSETQAALLRQLADGEQVNDVDWAHVIEEIEAVGRNERHTVEALLMEALAYALKLSLLRSDRDGRCWRHEFLLCLFQARRAYTPAMARHIDLTGVWQEAVQAVTAAYETLRDDLLALPSYCPIDLHVLMRRDGHAHQLLDVLLRRLAAQRTRPG
jgi:hypothetical protein